MSKWFQTPSYFFVCLCVGFISWLYTFHFAPESCIDFHETSLSSTALTEVDPELYNNDDIPVQYELTDDQLLQQVTITEDDWDQKGENPFELSGEELEDYETRFYQSFGDSAGDEIYIPISANEPSIRFEDPKLCKPNRLPIEKVITTHKGLFELTQTRERESSLLPRKCVTHVMNRFSAKPTSYARCANSKSRPARGGAKPCVTEPYVNLTYNSFVDVAECLNINPMDLLPKLSNESGMLMNILGVGYDAGIGQLTGVAIEETNKYYDTYFQEIQKAAVQKPSCARIMKYKSLLTKTGDSLAVRCGLIAPPENPLRNILYMAIFNRRNMDVLSGIKYIEGVDYIDKNGRLTPVTYSMSDDLGGTFGQYQIRQKLADLGLKNVNLNQLVEMVAFAGYNTGAGTAFNIFLEYIEKRRMAKRPLRYEDFDFHNTGMAKDIDGKVKKVTEIARLFTSSPMIKVKDANAAIKLQRVKLLPEKIRMAHLLTFPEFMIYNQNNYDKSRLRPDIAKKIHDARTAGQKELLASLMQQYSNYHTIGAPGYLGFLADKDQALRSTFEEAGASPDYCSNKNFLKIQGTK